MAKSRRNRQRRPGRRAPYRDPKPVILIVSEGENTEPQYLRGFTSACHNPRVWIEIAGEHGDPKFVVEAAKKLKNDAAREAKRQGDDNLAYDRVWCVFDVDEHSRIDDARQMARDNGIDLAISNPCFELWLLLHFQESPGMQHRTQVRKMLRRHVPGYDKKVEYATYAPGFGEAVTRAERLDESAAKDGEPGRNPTTGVYRLTESIREE